MKSFKSPPVVLFFTFFTSISVFAQDLDKIRVETIKLNDNVYMLSTGVGGNIGLCVGEDGAFLVDAEYRELAGKVREAVAEITDRPVKFLFNTHWHFDHVGGNKEFHEAGSTIIAHENVRKRMASKQRIGALNREVPPSPKEALPVITFTGALTFHLNGEEIAVSHFQHAHTDGDGVVHFRKSNVIHAGDIFFNCGYPFIDTSNGGGIDGMIAAVEKILKLCDDDTKIIPGHGPLADKKDLETYLAVLSGFRDIIVKEIEAGKSLQAVLDEKPTAELDEKWGKAFFAPKMFTEIVYKSLKER